MKAQDKRIAASIKGQNNKQSTNIVKRLKEKLGSKRIQEKNNEKETVILDEVIRTTVKDVTQVVESDSPLTDEQQEVYEILKKKQEINAIAVKERSADENKKLKQYLYELTKIKSNIIEDLLNKFPELRKQTKTKTGAQRVSALRSRQDEQKKMRKGKKTDFISVKCVLS